MKINWFNICSFGTKVRGSTMKDRLRFIYEVSVDFR